MGAKLENDVGMRALPWAEDIYRDEAEDAVLPHHHARVDCS
jgi:hypothetical protein